MAGNYDSMVLGPGNGDTVSAENSVRACDSSPGSTHHPVMTGWCCMCSSTRAVTQTGELWNPWKLHETSRIDQDRKEEPTARQESTLCGASHRRFLWPCMEAATDRETVYLVPAPRASGMDLIVLNIYVAQ
jgi:hypothetical protein